jgi:hypothetical protein
MFFGVVLSAFESAEEVMGIDTWRIRDKGAGLACS